MNILLFGRKNVATKALLWLLKHESVHVIAVVTDSHLEFSSTRDASKINKIKCIDLKDVESFLKKHNQVVDLGISILYWRKFSVEIINLFKNGIINFHPAPLPDYKGTAGYNMAILNNHSEWSVTAHYVSEHIDDGPIIMQKKFKIDSLHETAKSLENKSQKIIFKLFIKIMTKVLSTNTFLPSIPNIGGKYISREEMEILKEIKPNDDLDRKIRAFWFPPYDGAFIKINGKKYTLINDEILRQLANPKISSLFTNVTKK